MKSNELFEQIHSGEIKEDTKIEVLKESGEHIAFINYKNKKLNWNSGEFDTKYLCDIDTEFEIIEEDWKIKKLNTKNMYTGDRIGAIEDKINEIIEKINNNDAYAPF